METADPQVIYPAKQLKTLKEYYRLRIQDIVAKSKTSSNTVHKALQGESSVDLRNFVAIADALQADVIITLKARDPAFNEHLQKLLRDVSAIQ